MCREIDIYVQEPVRRIIDDVVGSAFMFAQQIPAALKPQPSCLSLMCMHVFAFCTHLFVLNPPSGILIVPFLFEQHSKPLVPVCNVWFNGIHLKTTAACQNDWMLRLHLPRHLCLMDITFEFPTTLT